MLESHCKSGNEEFSRRPTEFNEIIESIAVNCAPVELERADVALVSLLANKPTVSGNVVGHLACLIDRNSVEFALGVISGDLYAAAGI